MLADHATPYTSQWVNDGNLSSDELLHILRDRITIILSRYRGKIHYVDVVNESLVSVHPS